MKQEAMTNPQLDLTLDICAEDGSRTRFYQSAGESVGKTLRQLISPRLFNQPLLTLASEHSVSAIPSRTIDLILAHTGSPPALPLPPQWLDIVEVNGDTFQDNACAFESPGAPDKTISVVEIHTLGDWMVRLKVEISIQATIQEERQFLAHFSDLPVIPFRLQAGGIGFVNPPKISRVTVFPPLKGVAETALEVDLLQCIRP
jgi:hypothetical protein